MESLLWHLANRTAETEFIFNLFHLLLAGLTLLVLLRHLRVSRADRIAAVDWFLPLGFSVLVLHFGLLTLYFGAEFFYRRTLGWPGYQGHIHGLMVCGLLTVAAAFHGGTRSPTQRPGRWAFYGCGVVAGAILVDLVVSSRQYPSGENPHSFLILTADALGLLAVGVGARAVIRGEDEGRRASLVALASVGVALFLHGAGVFLPRQTGILIWNVEQHTLSISLFAFAWAAGERSRNLLGRIFVRLNLTFIVLASLIMLITAGMEKYQYLHLAEERSMNLAEFLRGHIIYYQTRREGLDQIFRHPEVLRRVVVEFGVLPELREVNVYLNGQRASFRYTRDWEIKEEIVPLSGPAPSGRGAEPANSFQMIRLPIESDFEGRNRIEFLGTMDYINERIGKYIILIYSLFTIMVGLATGLIGIIVSDMDRRLRRQYVELQETQHQLSQAAKLASVGELAGGVAHEINTPITSILSLATHLADGKSMNTLAPGQRESLQIIAQQAKRVGKIVKSLLSFARQSQLELSQVNVREVLETAINLLQYRLQDGRIQLHLHIDDLLPGMLGDAGRLTEVFVNLLNNSIDAMPQGGKLVVRTFANPDPEGGVRVEVTDTGCGIPPEDLGRVFDPFFTTKEPGCGTGLGLSISHGIVKDHGGQIWAESHPGAGTTLVVTLPKEVNRDDGAYSGDRRR